MNKQSRFFLLVLFLFLLTIGVYGNMTPTPVIFKSGKAEIVLQDHLHHPFFWWPNTLLSYPVVFEEEISPEKLILKDQLTGKQLPFQLTDIRKDEKRKTNASLHLISGLSPGNEHVFILEKGIPERFTPIAISEDHRHITVRTDKLEITFPVSQNRSAADIPGPVLSICRLGDKSMGVSGFNPGENKLEKLETKIIQQGPLFVELEISYRFTEGACYQAVIRCINGYDFVELDELMEGFPDRKPTSWEISWDGFNPTHRQAPNHPFGQPGRNPGFARFEWETVGQDMLNSHHGIMYSPGNGKIPFELGIYGNWPAERTVTSTVFWDENNMQSLGVFTKNIAFWDDREYSIWHSSGKLNVKFYHKDQKLRWVYPVFTGRRTTAISCYSHQNDIDFMNELEVLSQPPRQPRAKISQLSYNHFLQNRHSTIDLNKVKNWDLTYPEPLRIQEVIFPDANIRTVRELERFFRFGEFSNELAISGPCQNSGYSPVPARSFYGSYLPAFNQLLPTMTSEERARLSAIFLFHAYMAAEEEFMPMRAMLSGHPNFLADTRTIPAWAAFLFPEHSQAKNWSDMFAKYIELNTHYHTRPDVNLWEAQGGRWTENLGTYVWAFLGPTVKADYMIQRYGSGKNHLAQENVAQIGRWIMNSLSAPYDGESIDFYINKQGTLPQHFWGIVTKEEGPRRVHPPQGAHSARRKPSSSLWTVGQALQNYDPLLAENIRYVSDPQDQEMEQIDKNRNPFKIMYPAKDYDTGTPPDFKSLKMNGYGIILRAAVGTKDELSIHLQQIDKGPNYRWGVASEGGCGNIYFYAAGKSFSHNGREDSGDRRIQDTDLVTNFGAFKNGTFKSIGRNDLDRPLYDLSYGQFAEITSDKQSGYSWPEYKSRSVMLVGSDYFITYDDVFNNNIGSRFSWFTHLLEDLPEINVIKCGGNGFDFFRFDTEKTELIGRESKGLWYDGLGDIMTLVSHKKDFKLESAPAYGCIITGPDSRDYIFRNDTPVEEESERVFSGTAGFIRERTDGSQEFVLFHGTKIGNNRFEILSKNTDAGISALYISPSNIKGEFYSTETTEITFRWNKSIPQGAVFWLNGRRQTVKNNGNEMMVTFPSGKHIWNITTGLPVVCSPEIKSTQNEKNSVTLNIHPVAGAKRYCYEYSADAGKNWKTLKEQTATSISIKPEGKEKKGFVRVLAKNDDHTGKASVIYPLYFTDAKPNYPDGLKLLINKNSNDLNWGQVLGCTEYKLYRRVKGQSKFQQVYRGNERHFTDRSIQQNVIYEYVVTALDGNGESAYCHPVDNDPDSWLNFAPVPGEPFRRVGSRMTGTDNSGSQVDVYYPE